MQLAPAFPRLAAPGTGRRAIQLTSGPGTCYPLYYFIPSVTRDGRWLVHHRAADGEVQLVALDLASGGSRQLTHAACSDTAWRPWCIDSGRGVLDHRSVLDVDRARVLWFDGPALHAVDIASGRDELLFTLPPGRIAIGQNCLMPGGDWFVYIHADAEAFARLFPAGWDYGAYWERRRLCEGTALCARNLATGEERELLRINSPIHHVLPLGADRVVFCHPATENGMLLTDLRGGWYTHLRTQDARGGCVCHYVATERGIAYEVLDGGYQAASSGLYDPDTRRSFEFALPTTFGYTHTGCDPAGRLWFYENSARGVHDLHLLRGIGADGRQDWQALTGHWQTFGGGQKSHFHPRLTDDRRWILMTAGDPATGTNQIFLLDAADLQDTAGIPSLR